MRYSYKYLLIVLKMNNSSSVGAGAPEGIIDHDE